MVQPKAKVKDCQVVRASPNRKNVFLNIKKRNPNNYGIASYEHILRPVAHDLDCLGTDFAMTIIYMGLKYCGYAYKLFDTVIRNQFVEGVEIYEQIHASTTNETKEYILSEIKKNNSKIRVIFATTALGMGVDAPNITRIIHIGPSCNLECYIREFGRAGRSGNDFIATLYITTLILLRIELMLIQL